MSAFPDQFSSEQINWDTLIQRQNEMFKLERRRGGTEAASANFTVATEFVATGGDSMRFAYIPGVNVWWEVEYRFILRALDTTVWVRADPYVTLDLGPTTVDAAGVQRGPNDSMFNINASGIDYGFRNPRFTAKLEAGRSYTARCVIAPQSGTWNYWTGATYTEATAKVVGFW